MHQQRISGDISTFMEIMEYFVKEVDVGLHRNVIGL